MVPAPCCVQRCNGHLWLQQPQQGKEATLHKVVMFNRTPTPAARTPSPRLFPICPTDMGVPLIWLVTPQCPDPGARGGSRTPNPEWGNRKREARREWKEKTKGPRSKKHRLRARTLPASAARYPSSQELHAQLVGVGL